MRPLHEVVTRTTSLRAGTPVFAGTRVPVRLLMEHLDRGGQLGEFLGRHPSVSRELATAALALGLEALQAVVPAETGVPQRSLLPRLDESGAVANADELTAQQVVGRRVLCPACRTLVYRSWPGGWDAHAAHRCRGLRGNDPEERKREYKRRFEHLFR